MQAKVILEMSVWELEPLLKALEGDVPPEYKQDLKMLVAQIKRKARI